MFVLSANHGDWEQAPGEEALMKITTTVPWEDLRYKLVGSGDSQGCPEMRIFRTSEQSGSLYLVYSPISIEGGVQPSLEGMVRACVFGAAAD
jgi:hypothetical protein